MNRLEWLLETVSGATWIDWLDIALLSLVIYRVLVAMQGTRAVQSLLGLTPHLIAWNAPTSLLRISVGPVWAWT